MCLLPVLGVSSFAQNLDKEIRKGNELFKSQKYIEAKAQYEKVLTKDPNDQKAVFNGANASYKQEEYEQAMKEFATATSLLETNEEKAKAYHNLGNTYFKAQQLEKSVEAYKDALRLNPADQDTKYNLQVAKKLLKQQQNQDQQDQDQENQDQENEDQDNQDNQEKKDQNKEDQQDKEGQDQENEDQQEGDKGDEDQEGKDQKDEGKEDDQEKEQQGGGNEGEQGEEEQQEQQFQPSQLSKAEAERILEALMNQEQAVQEKLIEKETEKGQKVKVEKDW